jgi:hypothetical protein
MRRHPFKKPPCKRCAWIRAAKPEELHFLWHPDCTPEHAAIEGEKVRVMVLAMHAAEGHEDMGF